MMASNPPILCERHERTRRLLDHVRDVNSGTSDFPPLSNLVLQLINTTRSIWLDKGDFTSWLKEARAPAVLREMLSPSTWENPTLNRTSLELIIQSLLIVQDSGLSLRRRDCLVANCINAVHRNCSRRSESRRSVEVNVTLDGSGGRWCVGSIIVYPTVRPHPNSRLCNYHKDIFTRRLHHIFHPRDESSNLRRRTNFFLHQLDRSQGMIEFLANIGIFAPELPPRYLGL